MKDILVTNIQRFSLHDGPGIRTTIFLKGCSLRCPWCCNPENITPQKQRYKKDGVEGVYGTWYDTGALYSEIIKDRNFYVGKIQDYNITSPLDLEYLPGGVTFSGGEALLQIKQLEELLQILKEEHIHTAIETCLFASPILLNIALKYIDLFYVDIKILDSTKCKLLLQGNLHQYKSNMDLLLNSGKATVFRIPVIGGYTDDFENRQYVIEMLKRIKGNVLKVELMKAHNLGRQKYISLLSGGNSVKIPDNIDIPDRLLMVYAQEIQKVVNIPVSICEI